MSEYRDWLENLYARAFHAQPHDSETIRDVLIELLAILLEKNPPTQEAEMTKTTDELKLEDEKLDLREIEWMWTKYAEHGGMPLEELQILEKAHDEIRRWRESHASEGFSPDWCAAREALKEHLRTPSITVEELEGFKWALKLTKSDAEKKGFEYGPQSTVNKALAAIQAVIERINDEQD